MSNNIDKDIKDFNVFTQRVIKQIVSKDDEEIVKQIIELGIAEYIKKRNDLYETRILGKFNTDIDKDIEILEEIKQKMRAKRVIQVRETWDDDFGYVEAIQNAINKLKSYQEREKENAETIDTLQNVLNSSNQERVIKDRIIDKIKEYAIGMNDKELLLILKSNEMW